MEVLAHVLDGCIEDVAMETLNPSMEKNFASTSQVEMVRNVTPPTNSIEGPNKSTNNNIQTFRHVSLPDGFNSTKKQDLDKKWATLFYEVNILFNVV
jgi:hypothetical protein